MTYREMAGKIFVSLPSIDGHLHAFFENQILKQG